MATVNLYSRNVARSNRMITYACEKQIPGDPISSELCSTDPESAKRQFYAVREEHLSDCKKPFAEMVHSFSPEESKKITPELVNKIGHELATTMFPGHQALVVTHLDRVHYHNHIFVNRHHRETGKLTRDNMDTVKVLRALNDRICKEHDLSIPNREKKEREARVPAKVALMIKNGRGSYIADTMQKADYARSLATSYGQYQGIMAEFGIAVRIEKKNISYQYPGQKVAKRGKSMGSLYDKSGLERAFKENDEKFQKSPALRELLSSRMQQAKSSPGAIKGVVEELSEKSNGHVKNGVKDYSKHKIVPRREAGWARASEEELTQCAVPIDEMRKARRTNIIDYCKKNDIKLEDKGQGVHAIKGRSYVEVSDYEWRNKKNKTRGNLIDLVAAHKGMTFLEAIAEINGNKRLLLLQHEIGDVKRTYTSFYVPKNDRDQSKPALHHLGDLLNQHGASQSFADQLSKSNQGHVAKSGMIRLFAKDDESGAFEFVKGSDSKWSATRRGQFTNPFFEQQGTGRKANVYTDPFAFMHDSRKDLFPPKRGSHGQLVLMEPDAKLVDRFLSGQRHVDTLQLVVSDPAKPTKAELDFFGVLKSRYASHGVSIEFTSVERATPGRGVSLER